MWSKWIEFFFFFLFYSLTSMSYNPCHISSACPVTILFACFSRMVLLQRPHSDFELDASDSQNASPNESSPKAHAQRPKSKEFVRDKVRTSYREIKSKSEFVYHRRSSMEDNELLVSRNAVCYLWQTVNCMSLFVLLYISFFL